MYTLTNSKTIIRMVDGASIPADTANVDYVQYLRWLSQGNTPEPAEKTIPSSLSMAQARLALHDAGLLEQVEAGIASMGKKAHIEWEFRATVDRSSALVKALATALNLTESALDALFTSGAAL